MMLVIKEKDFCQLYFLLSSRLTFLKQIGD